MFSNNESKKKSTVVKTISLEDIRDFFNLFDTYSSYRDIKSKILDPAAIELQEKTDLYFQYIPIKKGKKVVSLQFSVFKKNNKKQSPSSQKNIDKMVKRVIPDISDLSLQLMEKHNSTTIINVLTVATNEVISQIDSEHSIEYFFKQKLEALDLKKQNKTKHAKKWT